CRCVRRWSCRRSSHRPCASGRGTNFRETRPPISVRICSRILPRTVLVVLMPIQTVADLVEALRATPLLSTSQLEELARDLQPRCTEPRALARQLLDRDWLTAYQMNQLFLGRGQDLVLGPYLLLERLGEGGVGQVFKARHLRMDRVVALKIIRKAK